MSRTNTLASRILYEDNHYIALNKLCGELVQGEGVIYVQICEKCEVLGGCFQCT